MCEKIRIHRVSDYPSARGGLEDILIMENMTNHLLFGSNPSEWLFA